MKICLTLLHSGWPKLLRVLAILSAVGLKSVGSVSEACLGVLQKWYVYKVNKNML